MKNKILWIDDDYYTIQGLFRPIEEVGYKLDIALSAFDGYKKAQKWQDYDLIVVDLILPISQEESAPEIVLNWNNQERYAYVGVGLVEWLLKDLKVNCPVVILSVVPDPISTFKLDDWGITNCIRKSGLLPTTLKDELSKHLNI
ncbi:MAG: response regulator [Anaerolineales bacterium]|nr:response regulator [Anaerolineales bacterium]